MPRDVRLIAGAVGLSAAGDTVLWVLLALHVGTVTGSAFAVSALFACLWLPVVALSRLAGRVVDRYENRRLLIGVSLAQAAAAAAMAGAVDTLPVLLALCVVLGCGIALCGPAEFALLPVAAGEDRIAAANGYVETARYAGMTAGPLIGGVLAASGLTRAGLLVDAATFLAIAAAGWALRARRAPDGASHAREHTRMRLCLADRTMAITFGAAILALLFLAVSITAEPFFATDVLDAGAGGYGVLMAAWTAGMVAGSMGLARVVPSHWLAAGALLGLAFQGAGLLGAALGATIAAALGAFVVGGAAQGAKNVLLRTLLHQRVPEQRRGQAFATYNAMRNGAELGALGAGGVVVGLAGPQLALALSGAIPLAIGAAALVLLARRAPIRRTAPAYGQA